jgi:hypothetical protein
VWAEENIMTSHPLTAYSRSASWTWLALTIADTQVIPHFHLDRLRSLFDLPASPLQYAAYGRVEAFELGVGEMSDECLWMNAGLEEDLVGVCVPDRAKNRLVIEKHTNLLSPVLCSEGEKRVASEFARQYIHTLFPESGNSLVLSPCCTIHLRHECVVREVESGGVVKFKGSTEMAFGVFPGALVLEASGKHQIDDQLAIGRKEELKKWPPGGHRCNLISNKRAIQWLVEGGADDHRLPNRDADDFPTFYIGVEICTNV